MSDARRTTNGYNDTTRIPTMTNQAAATMSDSTADVLQQRSGAGPASKQTEAAMSDDAAMIDEAVKDARRICGCVQCQGGYPIGEHALGALCRRRPASSCLAAILLPVLLARAKANGGGDE